MKNQIQKLIKFIEENKQVSYKQVKDFCESINPLWRSESWTRSLRKRAEMGCIEKIMENGCVVGYRSKNASTGLVGAKKGYQDIDQANNKLDEMLNTLKPTWDNYREVKDLRMARASKYLITKINIIDKYG